MKILVSFVLSQVIAFRNPRLTACDSQNRLLTPAMPG